MTFDRCFGCMEKLEKSDETCPHCGFNIMRYEEAEFALRPGTILHGRYVVGKVLGKGGFGITYIGYDMSLDIRVAIKEYYPEGFVGRDARQSAKLSWYSTRTGVQNVIKSRESLIKEARNMAKIDTFPTLVRVRDVLVANETAYLVMDYVEGETLKNLVVKNGTFSYEKVCECLFPIMEDLSKIHEKGIIHRDISPDNIMREVNGQMRLLDLGAAKDLYRSNGASGKGDEQVPASTQMVLKRGFSPMEQYRTHGGIGPWTDVYAMTATIYYLMSGRVLPTPMDRLDKEQEDAVQSMIDQFVMPQKAKEGMKKGLAILKDDRIKNMKELQEYFSSKNPKPEPKPKPQKRKTLPVLLLGLMGVVVAVGVVFTGIKLSHKSAEEYYEKGNYEEALNAYRQEKNTEGVKKTLQTMYDTAGNYNLGTNGYEKNEEEAIKYYRLVAEAEEAEEKLEKKSCYYLGYIMLKNGIDEDDAEAAAWFEKASEKGDTGSMYYLSTMYSKGIGVSQNQEKAIELLEQEADCGIASSMNLLGRIYEFGKWAYYVQTTDLTKALKWYKKAEEHNFEGAKENVQRVLKTIYETANNYRIGDNGYEKNEEEAVKNYKLVAEDEDAGKQSVVDASYYLGWIMSNNETTKDDTEAAGWYEKAVKEGDIYAMNNLANMYQVGQGVSQDYEKAMQLYKQAADGGNSNAMRNIGCNYELGECGLEIDLKKALKCFKKAQKNGYDDIEEDIQRVLKTIYEIANNYRTGDNGYEKNEEEAVKNYKLVAEDEDAGKQSVVDASYYLGWIMSNNETTKDDTEAAGWYEKAVKEGDIYAMNNLANMYQVGQGVSQDYEKAMQLYKQAADGGDSRAMNQIGYNYQLGECGQKIDFEKAIKWYKKAAENGNSTAMDNLGCNYEFGECGLQIDLKEALKWYKKAQENGYDDAEEHIQRVQRKLNSGGSDDAATEADEMLLPPSSYNNESVFGG